MSDPLTTYLVRQAVEISSKGIGLRLRTSQLTVTLSSRLDILRARFKEKNKVVSDGLILTIGSIHSNDEENV